MIGLSFSMPGDAFGAAFDLLERELGQMSRDVAEEAAKILERHAKEEAPISAPHSTRVEGLKHPRRIKGGTLRESIHATGVETIGGGYRVSVVADAPYAAFVHEGTRPHGIDAPPGGVLAFDVQAPYQNLRRGGRPGAGTRPFVVQRGAHGRQRKNKALDLTRAREERLGVRPGSDRVSSVASSSTKVYATHVDHPGTKPDPFFERAAEKAKSEIEAMIQERMARITQNWRTP